MPPETATTRPPGPQLFLGRRASVPAGVRSPIFHRYCHLVYRAVTAAGVRIGSWLTS
jgi:hypothetical protein